MSSAHLLEIIDKYKPHNLSVYEIFTIPNLKSELKAWASSCYIDILESGSRAKGTAISLASDVDYIVSLSSKCHENSGGLKAIYESLCTKLIKLYPGARKQNVSVRINATPLAIDVTPARKQPGSINDHWIYLSKSGTRQQTNIQKHISDILYSGRIKEIKLLKIWRELHGLDFPSIYLEYLLIQNILSGRSKGDNYLETNFMHILAELSKDYGNPLFNRIVDPANTSNILSDLLNTTEKNKIIAQAKRSHLSTTWSTVVW
jgi:hypothetical protein